MTTRPKIEDLKRAIETADRAIGAYGEQIVANNMERCGWQVMERDEFFPRMIEAGIPDPASFIDLGFRRFDAETEDYEWELVQVKTVCTAQDDIEFVKLHIAEKKLRRYIQYAQIIMSEIDFFCVASDEVTQLFPVGTKISVYIVTPIALYRVDMLDLNKCPRSETDPNKLMVYIGPMEQRGPLEPWHSDKERGRWTEGRKLESNCLKRNKLHQNLRHLHRYGFNRDLF